MRMYNCHMPHSGATHCPMTSDLRCERSRFLVRVEMPPYRNGDGCGSAHYFYYIPPVFLANGRRAPGRLSLVPIQCRACACIIPPVPVVYSGTVPGVLYYTVLYSTYPPVLRSTYTAQHYIV